MTGIGRLSVHLTNPYAPWSKAATPSGVDSGGVEAWARGQGWDGDRYLEGQELADWLMLLLKGARDAQEALAQGLRRLSGHYALVARTKQGILSCVDRMRTIPFFFGSRGNAFLLSDDAYAVRAFVGDGKPDDVAGAEFLLKGYVTGGDTTHPGVKQLQAEETVWATLDGRGDLVIERQSRAVPDSGEEWGDDLYPATRAAYEGIFGRLVKEMRDRQIVVPLSGGIDSRSVVAMLKLVGAENVLCFSYGRPGGWEAEISMTVARKLGYAWEFVPYTRKLWREYYRSPDRETYALYASNLVSTPHIQDWPAVGELKRAGCLSEGAVFVPGHTATTGLRYCPQGAGLEAAAQAALSVYRRWDWSDRREQLAPLFRSRIDASLAQYAMETLPQTVRAYERYALREGWSKFFVNSVRAYEFWGYDWRLPLFSDAMIDFWARVPLALRKDKMLCRQYLESELFSPLGISGLGPPETKPRRAMLVRAWEGLGDPYLSGYSALDFWRSWRDHTRELGGRWSSRRSLLSVNSLETSVMLRLWHRTWR